MSRLTTIEESKLTEETLAALSSFRQRGKLAPVYNQIANSEPALNAYLTMENALKQSSLSLREIEAIKLLVSQINQCDHCLAVHHMKATAAGLDDEQKRAIRHGQTTQGLSVQGEAVSDRRLSAIVRTVLRFFQTPGVLTDEQLDELRQAGLSDAELVDMAMVASTIFFTNIFNHLNDTRTTLPAAPAL